MKEISILSALILLTIFTACNKQDFEDELVSPKPELLSAETIDKTDTDEYSLASVVKASFEIDNEDNILFENDDLLLTNNSISAVSYHWDFGNGDSSTEAQPAYKYKIHGNYPVTLTVTDSYGNTHQVSHEITVLCLFGGGPHDQ